MKNKGFTLIELLVVITIVAILAGLIANDPDAYIINPELDAARNSRRIANELERQNDLKERELEMLEQEKRTAEKY